MDTLELTVSKPPSAAFSRPLYSASSRPLSSKSRAHPKSSCHVISDKSNVDEVLFTSFHSKPDDTVNCKSPGAESCTKKDPTNISKKQKLRPLLWVPEDRPTFTSHSDRTLAIQSNHLLYLNKYRPIKQVSSICDETLFGKRLKESSLEAPWSKKTKPLFFPLDYTKLTLEGSCISEIYSVTGTLDGRPPSRQGRRPATAGTRPATVESVQNIEKPKWRS